MLNSIINAIKSAVLPTGAFNIVIPVGTAIQNDRIYLGDTLNRDTQHLNHTTGTYTAGIVWFCALTGETADKVTYIPAGISADTAQICKESAQKAIDNMFGITE